MPAHIRGRAGRKQTESSLPDSVRIDVVIGTISTAIPAEWLSSDAKMDGVRKKMLGKVREEINGVISKAREQWQNMTK